MDDETRKLLEERIKCFFEFFSETSELLYVDQYEATFWFIQYVMPSEEVMDRLQNVRVDYPLGLSREETVPPKDVRASISKLQESNVYTEISNSSVRKGVRQYLGLHGYDEQNSDYELFELRIYGLVALVLSDYLSYSLLSHRSLTLPDSDMKSAIEAAKYLQDFLARGGQMATHEDADRLSILLAKLVRENSERKRSDGTLGYIRYNLPGNRNQPDHALRLVVMRMVIFFKIVNRKTPASLIHAVAALATGKIKKTTVDSYISAATDYMADKGHLKAVLYPELNAGGSDWQRKEELGIERYRAWEGAILENHRDRLKRNKVR